MYDVTNHLLNLTGLITLPAACSAHATEIIIPSSYIGRSKEPHVIHHSVQVPNLSSLINHSSLKELKQVMVNEKYEDIKTKLENLKQISLLPMGLPLEELQKEIKEVNRQDLNIGHWFEPRVIAAPTITTLAILGFMGGIGWCLCRPCAKSCLIPRHSSKGVFSGQRLKMFNRAQRRHPSSPVQEFRTLEVMEEAEPLHVYESSA